LAVGATILEEVVSPDAIVTLGSDPRRVPSPAPPPATTLLGQAQAQFPLQAPDPFKVHGPALVPPHRPSPSIAATGVPPSQVPQPPAEGPVSIRARAVSQTEPADAQQSAGAPLGDPPPMVVGRYQPRRVASCPGSTLAPRSRPVSTVNSLDLDPGVPRAIPFLRQPVRPSAA
jgi:hypothetical protein